MYQLANGWWVPDNEQKITGHVSHNVDKENPTYESRVRELIIDALPTFGTFIDVGANIGIWSYPFSKKFNKVIAYEPSPRNLECLYNNVQEVEIHEAGLGDTNSTLNFVDSMDNCGNAHIVNKKKKHSYEIEVRRLDDENLQECNLIKIDVQGYEWQVIQGAKQTIEKFTPWVIFEPNQDVEDMVRYFKSINYSPLRCKSKTCWVFAPTTGPNAPNTAYFGINPFLQQQQIIKELYYDFL
jgi:FkbM family methyltransferase